MPPRSSIWPPNRPPLPVNSRHFQTRTELEEYFSHERIECLECGKLGRHITGTHKMLVKEYNKKWGIPLTRGLVGTVTRVRLADNAIQRGLNIKSSDNPGLLKTRGMKRSPRTASYLLNELSERGKRKHRKGQRWAKEVM